MNAYALRALVAAAIAVLLFAQSRRIPAQNRRRRAFELAATAFAIFVMGNGLALLGLGGDFAMLGGYFIGAIVLLFSLLGLFSAYRSGEMNDQMQQMRDMIAEERARARKPGERNKDEV